MKLIRRVGGASLLFASQTEAFAAHQPSYYKVSKDDVSRTSLYSLQDSNNIADAFSKACLTAAMTCALWGAPTFMAEQTVNNHILPLENVPGYLMAQAKDKASATGSRVNKDADSLLRYGLPINNKQV